MVSTFTYIKQSLSSYAEQMLCWIIRFYSKLLPDHAIQHISWFLLPFLLFTLLKKDLPNIMLQEQANYQFFEHAVSMFTGPQRPAFEEGQKGQRVPL